MKMMVLIIVFSPSVIETMECRRTYYHLWAEDSKIGKLRTQDSATAWHTLTHIRRSCASAKHNENDVSLIRFRRGACGLGWFGGWVVGWCDFRVSLPLPLLLCQCSHVMRKVSTLKDVSMGNLGTACFQQTQPKCAVCMHIECITFVFRGKQMPLK